MKCSTLKMPVCKNFWANWKDNNLVRKAFSLYTINDDGLLQSSATAFFVTKRKLLI